MDTTNSELLSYERRLRLFAVRCARVQGDSYLLDMVESFARGRATRADLDEVRRCARVAPLLHRLAALPSALLAAHETALHAAYVRQCPNYMVELRHILLSGTQTEPPLPEGTLGSVG